MSTHGSEALPEASRLAAAWAHLLPPLSGLRETSGPHAALRGALRQLLAPGRNATAAAYCPGAHATALFVTVRLRAYRGGPRELGREVCGEMERELRRALMLCRSG